MIEPIKLDITHPLHAAHQLTDKLNEIIAVVNSLSSSDTANTGDGHNGETQTHSQAIGSPTEGAG